MNVICKTAKTVILVAAIALLPQCVLADESGSGYWFNGSAFSLSAAKQTPGCSVLNIFYFASQSQTANVTLANGETVRAKVNTNIPIYIPGLGCTPRKKILGGQLTASFTYPLAHVGVNANATPTGTANVVKLSDSATNMADLYPNINLRWNQGVNNYMVYVQPGVPIGPYSTTRLANIGAGHITCSGGNDARPAVQLCSANEFGRRTTIVTARGIDGPR